LGLSRPTDARRWRVDDEHLSGAPGDDVVDVLDAPPVRRQHEERLPIGTSERAREAGPIELDPLQDLSPFSDTHALSLGVAVAARVRPGVRRVGPDGAVRIETDAVGADAFGPCPAVR